MSSDVPADGLLPQSAELRRVMVDRQVRTFDVTDQVVIARLLDIPREIFVDPAHRPLAYSDVAIDLAGSDGRKARTMLTPLVLGRMLQAAEPQPDQRVLDVAGGTGYTAALLAGLVAEVVTLESDAALSARAKTSLAALGLSNVRAICGPLTGPVEGAPFDIIVVNGCAEDRLAALAAMLTVSGRIFAIVPRASGSLCAAQITGRGDDLSVRPLFDAAAARLDAFRREPQFAF
jgi:protein-L-isoaspartate(D-aspartate) O-methyltransferase